MRNSGIGTVLYWQPLDVHIFHTDPSLHIMAYASLIIGRTGFGSKDDLWEIIFPESYGGVTFDLGPLLQRRMWSLIPIMAYIFLTITHVGFGCEDNLQEIMSPESFGDVDLFRILELGRFCICGIP